MPYIEQQRRTELEEGATPHTPGELNYAVTDLLIRYLWNKTLNYGHINDVVGVLECAKQELYRRVAVNYENGKIAMNGDVYPPHLTN